MFKALSDIDLRHMAGIGLRNQHFSHVQQKCPDVPWLEIHTENFFAQNSAASHALRTIRKDYPISAHCVGLSLGSTKLDQDHLQKIKETIDWLEPIAVSDHLSWSHNAHHHLPDLLPSPYNAEALGVFVNNIEQVQDTLGRQILVENPSSYLAYKHSTYSEWDFLAEVQKRSGCGLLLDINNIYVSAHNHQFDALNYIKSLPQNAIAEIHLAGFEPIETEGQTVFVDTHSMPVHAPVWQLYKNTIELIGPRPTLIEWDNNLPDFTELDNERLKAQTILNTAQTKAA